jgi:hypothetical protein
MKKLVYSFLIAFAFITANQGYAQQNKLVWYITLGYPAGAAAGEEAEKFLANANAILVNKWGYSIGLLRQNLY